MAPLRETTATAAKLYLLNRRACAEFRRDAREWRRHKWADVSDSGKTVRNLDARRSEVIGDTGVKLD